VAPGDRGRAARRGGPNIFSPSAPPSPQVFVRRLWNVPPSTALIFNCQMGRGRTTTGMIIASLLLLRRMGAFPPPRDPDAAGAGAGAPASPDVTRGPDAAALPPQPAWFAAAGDALAAPPPGGDRLKAGLWGVVRSLLRVLESGNLGKAALDAVVDAASAMQNLRDAIAQYRSRVLAETKERRRATLMAVCLEYLERCGAGVRVCVCWCVGVCVCVCVCVCVRACVCVCPGCGPAGLLGPAFERGRLCFVGGRLW
jgi:hypothetical protein